MALPNGEVARFVYAYVFLQVVVCIMVTFQQISDWRWLGSETKTPLRDGGFEYLPRLNSFDIPDFLVLSLFVSTMVCLTISSKTMAQKMIFWRRIFWISGCLYLFRAFTFISTTLPPTKECQPVVGKDIPEMLRIGGRMIFGIDKACTDNIYSGHTMMLTSCIMLWKIYCPNKPINTYVQIHALVGLVTIVASRLHYTVDVILSLFITYAMYSIYFFLVRIAMFSKFHCGIELLECSHNDEYQRIAFTPEIVNRHLVPWIVWMDGLDLRWEEWNISESLPFYQPKRNLLY
ncbi:hypothetical protein K493DRAFT_307274 [Basidiobolus meristosporus CBS 931.73]|uniref:Sphingomyelin synthase-like domain-containing protein n=1 Tax=Basidiobolus meristosporus CBS 931.73 TaxID=1314790 RepID=A0A1Y1XHZ5_9FUNG|nr:hypothetical protein K493DRAFT_307274 [Basidiobolus meristosporus CBS 931.73]|eukprot:ORX85367.1 hypothetical protein K493DRAFT_307274 [Basidiobolus meristosporus CBS 931.73]